jgi:hypothetical protein
VRSPVLRAVALAGPASHKSKFPAAGSAVAPALLWRERVINDRKRPGPTNRHSHACRAAMQRQPSDRASKLDQLLAHLFGRLMLHPVPDAIYSDVTH